MHIPPNPFSIFNLDFPLLAGHVTVSRTYLPKSHSKIETSAQITKIAESAYFAPFPPRFRPLGQGLTSAHWMGTGARVNWRFGLYSLVNHLT
jgi:hypothetical protein